MKAKDLLYIAIIISIMTFFLNDCSREQLIEKKTVEISDTTWNWTNIDTTVYEFEFKDTTIYNISHEKVEKPLPNRTDSLRHYAGIYNMDFGKVFWQADVSGFLEEISFSGNAEIPEIRTTKIGTVTKTVEITRLPRWNLYGGITGSAAPSYFEIGPSVNLRLGKLQYGYSYGLINQSHSISIQTKLF
jgi:hypothetical protein